MKSIPDLNDLNQNFPITENEINANTNPDTKLVTAPDSNDNNDNDNNESLNNQEITIKPTSPNDQKAELPETTNNELTNLPTEAGILDETSEVVEDQTKESSSDFLRYAVTLLLFLMLLY